MYKNSKAGHSGEFQKMSFNPCFNGTMYKNDGKDIKMTTENISFNPCFNGTMYKNGILKELITN